jgi:hypothetical protein
MAAKVGRIFALVMHCSALSGCYAIESAEMDTKRYTHHTAGQQQFVADKHECLQQAQRRHSPASLDSDGGFAIACMGARGYQEDPNGPLGG